MLILLGGGTSCIIGASETKELPSFVSGSNGDFASTSLPWHLECLQTGGDGAGEHPRVCRTAVNNEDCRPVSKVQGIAKASCRARVWLSSRALVYHTACYRDKPCPGSRNGLSRVYNQNESGSSYEGSVDGHLLMRLAFIGSLSLH